MSDVKGHESEETIVARLQSTAKTSVQEEKAIVSQKKKAQRGENILTISVNGVSFDMVRVEASTFTMGGDIGDGRPVG